MYGVERILCLRTGRKIRVLRKHCQEVLSKYEWVYFLGITLLEAGAPFTPWDSLSILFIATSESPDETLKEGRRWLDLVC